MKKSTKIILIASGTVIVISVILIVVLAWTIRASEPGILPPQRDSTVGEKVLCRSGAGVKDAGVKIDSNINWEEINGQYKVTLSWEFSGTRIEEWKSWVKSPQQYGFMNDIYISEVEIRRVDKGVIEKKSVNIQNPFPGGKFEETITPKEGEVYAYRVGQEVCWREPQTYNYYMRTLTSDLHERNFSDLDNPQDSTREAPAPPPDGIADSTTGGICECKQYQGTFIKTTLDFIVCEIRCMLYKAVVWSVQTAYNFMVKYSGLDPTKTEQELIAEPSD